MTDSYYNIDLSKPMTFMNEGSMYYTYRPTTIIINLQAMDR